MLGQTELQSGGQKRRVRIRGIVRRDVRVIETQREVRAPLEPLQVRKIRAPGIGVSYRDRAENAARLREIAIHLQAGAQDRVETRHRRSQSKGAADNARPARSGAGRSGARSSGTR